MTLEGALLAHQSSSEHALCVQFFSAIVVVRFVDEIAAPQGGYASSPYS